MTSGETDLDRLIAAMDPVLALGVYVFVTLPEGQGVPGGLAPRMAFHEAEGVTLILEENAARAAGLDGVFPSRMITLNIHSSLEAVGFLARLLPVLARAGMGVNPVSAYFHDHLFVPADRAEEAVALLRGLSSEVRDR